LLRSSHQVAQPLRTTADRGVLTIADVDREQALQWLPEQYALALRLRDAGASSTVIAAALEVDDDAADTVLVLAESKLHELLIRPAEENDRS
jgi:hypothetical protein